MTLQLLGAVFVLAALFVGVFSSHASATTPITNGTVVLKLSSGGAVATSPVPDNQNVDISVAANSTLNRSSLEGAGFPSGVTALKVLQCADPGGQAANLPKKSSDCEPATVEASAALGPDGSFAMQGYTIDALPDQQLGASSGTICDDTHECVLGLFTNYNDFTKPHLFSAPFLITAATTASAGSSSSPSSPSSSGGSTNGASPGVSVSPSTLANTGSPTLWPWLLGAGFVLLVLGSVLRYIRRPVSEGRRT